MTAVEKRRQTDSGGFFVMNIKEEVFEMKQVSSLLAASDTAQRNDALMKVAELLMEHKEEIFAENKKDLAAAEENQIPMAIVKRLKFDEGKLQSSVEGLRQLAALPDPLNRVTLDRNLDEGLRLVRVTCPIGVIGVILEHTKKTIWHV